MRSVAAMSFVWVVLSLTACGKMEESKSETKAWDGVSYCSKEYEDKRYPGWGWKDGKSCKVSGNAVASASAATGWTDPYTKKYYPYCKNYTANEWGWENNMSCKRR